MGFGLNVVLVIIKAIVDAVLSKDVTIRQATSAYIDDIYTNETIVHAEQVRQHLANLGLECKTQKDWRTVFMCSACRSGGA